MSPEKGEDQTAVTSSAVNSAQNLRQVHAPKEVVQIQQQQPKSVQSNPNSGVTPGKRQHMMFEEGKRFAEMWDVEKTPYMDTPDLQGKYVYFEPSPRDKFDDTTLEGCLYNFGRIETLVDKQNLYLCELCTEEKYGKSKSTTIKQQSGYYSE